MNPRLTRRTFLAASAAAGLAAAVRLDASSRKNTFKKSQIGEPSERLLKRWKAAGFDGMESTAWNVSPEKAASSRELADSLGMKIHSVLFGWAKLNQGEAALAEGVAQMQTALQAAQAYGAGAVLYVPCLIQGMPMPRPWEFDIRFDERTGHLRQVIAGDNAPFQKYIEAHDRAVDASREGIRRMIPAAEKAGVTIAVENVWNNLWVKPDFFVNFVASFQSPWVKVYFDIGNHVQYAPPQEWLRAIGPLLAKCHVKDFKLKPDGHGGDFCEMREGSVNWPAVRKTLDQIGYQGWMTIEGSELPIDEQDRRLDLILAGK